MAAVGIHRRAHHVNCLLIAGVALGLLRLGVQASTLAADTPFTPPADSPLARREHPRLFFTAVDLPGIRQRILQRYRADFESYVSALDGAFGGSSSGSMLYFDTRSYAFLCAIDPGAMGIPAGHSRQDYCNKSVQLALAISSGCEDARHDFAIWWTTGGCRMSPSIAYDWTYSQITETQRQQLADKIVALYEAKRGTDVFPPYNQDRHNISNQILPYMHGVIFGPLAVWGDPYVPASKAQEMLDHMAQGFLTRVIGVSDSLYGPDGDGPYQDLWGSGNPEGPDYGYSIMPAYMYPVAAASTALGADYFANSPFTKAVPLFYYYKLKPFPVNGNYYYAWHDTGTPEDASYPTTCTTSECHATLGRLLRLWTFNLRGADPNLAGVTSWMVGASDFRIPFESYKYAEGIRMVGLFGMFLGGERDVPPKTPDQAGLPLFVRMGDWTVFKSSHDLSDSTYLEIDSPIWQYVGGHNKDVPTGLQLSKFGTLLVRTVNTKGGSSCPRVDDIGPAAGSVTGPYTDSQMSLGMPSLKTDAQASPSQVTEGSPSDVGDITVFDSLPGVYDVFGYDYSRMYQSGKSVDQAYQEMVYLRGPTNHEFFVERNHVVSGYPNRKLLHAAADIMAVDGSWSGGGNPWTSTARTYSITNTFAGSHGRLFVISAWPEQAEFVKFGGPGHEWVDADGNPVGGSLGDLCRYLSGFYTLQVRTTEDDLITVYQPGDANTLGNAASTANLTAAGMKGVQVEDKIVLFNAAPRQPLASTSYTLNASGPTRHILVGMAPDRSYSVAINGQAQGVSSSPGGVLSFVDQGSGSRQITVGDGSPIPTATPGPTPTPPPGSAFADVPAGHWAHGYIGAVYRGGYVAGCATNPLRYCPETTMTRGEMAVFVERGLHGGGYLPPDPGQAVFADVPLAEWFAKWADGLWRDRYTAGCGTTPLIFCPLTQHTRAEATVYFERMLNGPDFQPSEPGTAIYDDVPLGLWYTKWVDAAQRDGLLQECEEPAQRADLLFRPAAGLSRAEAACMMVRAKGLSTAP